MMIASFRNHARFTMLFFILAALVSAAALTDGQERRAATRMELNPAVRATTEKLQGRISFEVTRATLAQFLSAVSDKIGVPVVQAPGAGDHRRAERALHREGGGCSAYPVLMEALKTFELSVESNASGVTIVNRPSDRRTALERREIERPLIVHGDEKVMARHVRAPEPALQPGRTVKREFSIETEENGVKSPER